MLTAVTGINWGDEGKGRVIDLLAEQADVVVRYQGGNNAGHTVVTTQGKFVLNLLPSGILHPGVVCVLGDGMVVDLEHLSQEIHEIEKKGIRVTPDHLKLSKRATISMPWHKVQDELEENRLAKTGSAFGSTRRGIAYAYSDKYRKKTLRLGDLLHLKEDSVCYDIGSGTGSIAVEAALRSKQLRVYAVEHGEEACGLIAENASRAGVKNLVVVKGEAPECLGELPVPTHAFIGGSGGRLREILLALREKNPNVRVVLNAVSLETVAEVVALRKELLICEEEITQIAVSRAKKAGSHHLMQAENPIYVISFSLSENGEGEEQKTDRREER